MTAAEFTIVPAPIGRAASDELLDLLHRLPDWFGQPAAIDAYGRRAAELKGWLAMRSQTVIGALFVEPVGEDLEIHVMAVDAGWHRRGVGRALVAAAATEAAARKASQLLVKTLSSLNPDPHYARTRQFYEALGFVPLKELPDEWGPANPCLLMARRVGHSGAA